MAATTPFLPRIQYLHPALLRSDQERDAHLERCAATGFDHILVPAPDIEEDAAADALRALQRACASRKLSLLALADAGSFACDDAIFESHPEWFVESRAAADDLPDPRRPLPQQRKRQLRLDRPQIVEAISLDWQRRLDALMEAGIAGFCCAGFDALPARFWQDLIQHAKSRAPSLRFLAWTPGSTADAVAALAGCGFDATFSSSAWWDYRSHWLSEEYARLDAVAPPIAFPDSPFESVIDRGAGHDDTSTRRQVHLRALRLAASIGNGMLMPMGFEYGVAATGMDAASYHAACAQPAFDLSSDVAAANAMLAGHAKTLYRARLRLLSSGGSSTSVLLRAPLEFDTSATALLIAVNADITQSHEVHAAALLEYAEGFVGRKALWPAESSSGPYEPGQGIMLPPGGLQTLLAAPTPPIVAPVRRAKAVTLAAARAPRIAIEAITPTVDGGRFPVKRTIGEVVDIEADVFMDGHDKLAVALLWRAADETGWRETRMRALGNDRWAATLPLTRVGSYQFAIEAWRDAFATYRDELEKKSTAGLDVSLELEEGRLLVEAAAAFAQEKGVTEAAPALKALAKSLKAARSRSKDDREKATAANAERIAALLSEPAAEAMRLADARPFAVRSEPPLRIDADRAAARFSSWYELFPRSQSGDASRHGTFDDVIRRLPAIQAMGFDTLYFPPIHPIGKKNRKGRNNSLTPAADDPGSPYAIGSDEGGHDAIHPQLGTIDDFRRLRDEAHRHGIELALDFAIQCSPDHPWLKDHPDWFDWRPDGTIRYAENPPKKYQDIVNVDFYAEGSVPALWNALRDVVAYWAKEGVRVFRVDNPHTKTLPFWEWMIADIRSRYPDALFLSEAFTRPKVMYRLAKVGFSQSYTYFTWRHSKRDFIDYMTELTSRPVCEFFRPHFFVNTPDINPPFLQQSGRPGFLIRAALAATLSGLWGVYSGFELCEATPVPGKEEYLDSEKYEIRAWDWQRPGNIVEEITQLNRIRRENPALQSHLGIRFLPSSDDNVLVFLKSTRTEDADRLGDNVVLVAVNLDPFNPHDSGIELPLRELGLPDDGALHAVDLVHGNRLVWHGMHQRLWLDPLNSPYAIWRIEHQGA